MGLGDLAGRARVNPQAPDAFGECDGCGFWFQRRELNKQMEYNGTGLYWTGNFVCPTCLDKPQAQFLTPRLPGDPRPVREPRPPNFPAAERLFGFTTYELPLAPIDMPTMLSSVAAISGIATPAGATSQANALVTIGASQVAQQILGANPVRDWLLVYNPNGSPIVVSTGSAAFSGDPFAIILGEGQALFWATAQGLGPAYEGALTAAGYFPGLPFFVFEDPSNRMPPIPVVMP